MARRWQSWNWNHLLDSGLLTMLLVHGFAQRQVAIELTGRRWKELQTQRRLHPTGEYLPTGAHYTEARGSSSVTKRRPGLSHFHYLHTEPGLPSFPATQESGEPLGEIRFLSSRQAQVEFGRHERQQFIS